MRVGRINSVKMMPYRDIKALMKMFATKGVALSSKQELSDIQTLQPKDENSIKNRIDARNQLNSLVIEAKKNRLVLAEENKNGLLSEKNVINIIKNMDDAKKGVKVSSLDFLMKSDVSDTPIAKSMKKSYYEYENINSENKDDNYLKTNEKENIIKESKNILKEYDEILAKIDEKRQKEKEDEKNKEKEEDKNIQKI